MAKHKKESFFWASYSDLMTSLFFVMLSLFVLSVIFLRQKMDATEKQLEKIKEIEQATQNIDSSYFEYREEYKKHILKVQVNFETGKSDIKQVDPQVLQKLLRAGKVIENFIKDKTSKYGIQYLLIIEGQASKDGYSRNYELSYERALSLRKYWTDYNINFGDNCEVLISGSGTGGTIRELKQSLNQRFLIHIIPKPGIIK